MLAHWELVDNTGRILNFKIESPLLFGRGANHYKPIVKYTLLNYTSLYRCINIVSFHLLNNHQINSDIPRESSILDTDISYDRRN